ncbi:hypothetical protein M758_UG296100 [Ceratodon purpureus]|nr:hypothetical protein M758_UG296100 [Ceratodon purpureus]
MMTVAFLTRCRYRKFGCLSKSYNFMFGALVLSTGNIKDKYSQCSPPSFPQSATSSSCELVSIPDRASSSSLKFHTYTMFPSSSSTQKSYRTSVRGLQPSMSKSSGLYLRRDEQHCVESELAN